MAGLGGDHSRVTMVSRRKGWMYLGMMQNTWTTASQRPGVRGGAEMQPRPQGLLDFSLFLPASTLIPNPLASPHYLTPHTNSSLSPRHPIRSPASLLVPYSLPLGPTLPLAPTFAGPLILTAGPWLTASKSTEHQLEGHEHITQVVGLRYDLHAVVLGVIEDPRTLQVRVPQLRVAHITNVQEPGPHIPQGPG